MHSSPPYSCYMPCPSHPPWLHNPNYVWLDFWYIFQSGFGIVADTIQGVLQVSTENWRTSTMTQNNENNLYKHGSGNVSVPWCLCVLLLNKESGSDERQVVMHIGHSAFQFPSLMPLAHLTFAIRVLTLLLMEQLRMALVITGTVLGPMFIVCLLSEAMICFSRKSLLHGSTRVSQ
jgi:hypothetical protein